MSAVVIHPALDSLMEPIGKISQMPGNANNGDIDEITQSIMVNGLYRPIIAQRSTGHIMAGNNLYAACLGLGMEQVPVIWIDTDDPIRILVGDNQIARLARMDDAALVELVEYLERTELGLLGTGFADQPLPYVDAEPFEPPAEPPAAEVHATYTCPHCGYRWSNDGVQDS